MRRIEGGEGGVKRRPRNASAHERCWSQARRSVNIRSMASPARLSSTFVLPLALSISSWISMLACGGTVAPDTSADAANDGSAIDPPCPAPLGKDTPHGACSPRKLACVYDLQTPCPDGTSIGPLVEYQCTCPEGGWSCGAGKVVTHPTCPPVDTPADAGPPDVGPPVGPITPGCPIAPPTSGQLCKGKSGYPDEHFYCHYFLGGDKCATEWKCTNGGVGEPTRFDIGTKNCGLTVDTCAAGKPCGSVEPSASCVVECDHVCVCGTDGNLACSPTPCH